MKNRSQMFVYCKSSANTLRDEDQIRLMNADPCVRFGAHRCLTSRGQQHAPPLHDPQKKTDVALVT
ncbi:hypothetical protein INR49_025344 [Caranx melampygus]|nr:hypothetical protein INR49_025344 [Caranx melampygus]